MTPRSNPGSESDSRDEFIKDCFPGPQTLRRRRRRGGRSGPGAPPTGPARARPLRHGPEFVVRAIRDWCRQTGAKTSYIEPGSPWQNPSVESFNSRARDELFAREIFDSTLEAPVLNADWCWSYNYLRPHSALDYQPPAAFAKAFSQQSLLLRLARLSGSPQRQFEGVGRATPKHQYLT